MTLRLPLFFIALLMWACGDPPLDFVDLSAYQAAEDAAKQKQIKEDAAKQVAEEAAMAAAKQSLTSFTDYRDGKVYKQVTIGSQTWMAENLGYEIDYEKIVSKQCREGSNTTSWWCVATGAGSCYEDSPINCNLYGRLYNWYESMVACPSGWHLPTSIEFETLFETVGMESAGKKLKSTNGWGNYNYQNGTDDYGFAAQPAGFYYSGYYYSGIGESAYFWSSTWYGHTSEDAIEAYLARLDLNYGADDVYIVVYNKLDRFSVRCVKDSP